MNDNTFFTSDSAFRSSNFYTYLEALTPRVTQNLQSRITKETLANHLNQLFFIPDIFFDYSECLLDQYSYCQEFLSEISLGNTELDFLYVYLEPNMTPHWVFEVEREHLQGEEIDVRLDFKMTGMHSCEVVCLTDVNGNEVALDIHSTSWIDKAAEFKAAEIQSVHS